MTFRRARCHCGTLVLRCEGEHKRISICHCLDCQRRTGSAFSIAVFYGRDAVRLEQGTPRRFERDAASGFPITFHFCDRCGSNLYWEPSRLPELTGVAIGAFADPSFAAPEQSVWTKDKHAWLELPEGIPAFEANPPPRGSRR